MGKAPGKTPGQVWSSHPLRLPGRQCGRGRGGMSCGGAAASHLDIAAITCCRGVTPAGNGVQSSGHCGGINAGPRGSAHRPRMLCGRPGMEGSSPCGRCLRQLNQKDGNVASGECGVMALRSWQCVMLCHSLASCTALL